MHEVLVAHHVPGRLRLKVPGAPGAVQSLAEIEAGILELPGVSGVEVRPATGSIVIEYDVDDAPDFVDTAAAFARALGISWIDLTPATTSSEGPFDSAAQLVPTPSELARVIIESFRSLNRELMQASDNAVDLRVLLPLAVTVLGARPGLAMQSTPMWMTSLMFAFSSFVSLHQELRTGLADELLEYRRTQAGTTQS
jgi:hypothetical protein